VLTLPGRRGLTYDISKAFMVMIPIAWSMEDACMALYLLIVTFILSMPPGRYL
jgi:hypothetical protein